MRDRRLCRLDIAVRYRVLLLRPDAWSSGLASFRRLSARDASHAHRDTCLWNAVKRLASRPRRSGPLRVKTGTRTGHDPPDRHHQDRRTHTHYYAKPGLAAEALDVRRKARLDRASGR